MSHVQKPSVEHSFSKHDNKRSIKELLFEVGLISRQFAVEMLLPNKKQHVGYTSSNMLILYRRTLHHLENLIYSKVTIGDKTDAYLKFSQLANSTENAPSRNLRKRELLYIRARERVVLLGKLFDIRLANIYIYG
jgi:hypothetical protein